MALVRLVETLGITLHLFAPLRHLRSLATPIFRRREEYVRGFRPGAWLETLLLNAILRFIGVIIRLFLVALSVGVLVVVGIGGWVLVLLWVVWPLFALLLMVGGAVMVGVGMIAMTAL